MAKARAPGRLAGGVGTFSGVNADSYNENGEPIPQIYHGRTRRERHEELVAYAIAGRHPAGAHCAMSARTAKAAST